MAKSEPIRITTVASYWTYIEAWTARNLLAANGIPAFVESEFYVMTFWREANACGGVRVSVPREHLPDACAILDEPPTLPADLSTADAGEEVAAPVIDERVVDEDATTNLACSKCGSQNVDIDRMSRRWIFLSFLLLGFPLPFRTITLLCYECGFRDGPRSTFGPPQFQIKHLLIVMTITAVAAAVIHALGDDAMWRLYEWFRGSS